MDPDKPTPATQTNQDTWLTWILENPTLPLIALALIALPFAWTNLKKTYTRRTGKELPPIGNITKQHLTIAYREDNRPITRKNPNLNWLTWTRLTTALTALTAITLTLALPVPPLTLPIPLPIPIALTIATITLILHANQIYKIRNSVIEQMEAVALGEMGAAAVTVTKWRALVYPSTTIVNYPAKYRCHEPQTRERFESNFSASTAESHDWIFTWEPPRNRVICEPTPLLPTKAPYPIGPQTHPWDEIPIGITADGEATVRVSEYPHMLIAGSTGSGKAIEHSTKIATPSGWTTMGELRVGDQVFDENGHPCTVTWVSDLNEQPDLYEVVFSDGSVIKADAEHLWFTETRASRVSMSRKERNTLQRRSLLTPEARTWIDGLLCSVSDLDEITLTQFAAGIGVPDTPIWLREVADRLGPVGEIQIVRKFHYSAQVVRQQQKVRVYDASEAWSALAAYRSKGERTWGPIADRVSSGDLDTGCASVMTLGELSAATGVNAATLRHALIRLGVKSVKSPDAHPLAPLLFVAGEVWSALAPLAQEAAPSWGHLRGSFAERAAKAVPGSVVTSIELVDALELQDPAQAACVMRNCSVSSRVEKRTVELQVPAKTVERAGRFTRTYLTRALCEAVLERTQRPAHSQDHKRALGSVKTTREIAETLLTDSGHHNHSIPVAGAFQLPEVDLPIDPYVLGVWLGDGSSRRGEFCGVDHEVARFAERAGYELEERTVSASVTTHPDFRIWLSRRLHTELRRMDLLQRTTSEGSRKCIPAMYLRASIGQRRELLAGLLDTDGTVSPQGACQFANTNEVLARQVHELALSLGYRATLTSTVKRAQTGAEVLAWNVAWTCDESPFRLTRKTESHAKRNQSYTAQRNDARFITEVRKVPSSPALCIQVDSPSRLFLAGEAMIPTHNSVTQRAIMLHLLRSPEWRVVCIDMKRVELSEFRKYKKWGVLEVAVDLEQALTILRSVEAEMMRRYTELESAGANNYRKYKPEAPAVMVMVDELFQLLSMEGGKDEEAKERNAMRAQCTTLLSSIARLGRGAGIHLIMATQRPDATVLPGELKALAVDTPVPTPSGWSTMGDLRVGDEVFDDSGVPCRVVDVSPVYQDAECYELEFSDGSTVVADAGHRWLTHHAAYRVLAQRAHRIECTEGHTVPMRVTPSVVTTREISESLTYHGKSNHAVPVAGALHLPDAELPLDPYVLGVWLGDGNSYATTFTSMDEAVKEEVGRRGFDVWCADPHHEGIQLRFVESGTSPNRWHPGVKGILRDLGVLGNKHIPDVYLRASRAQRLDLLYGLMDTDGTACRRVGKGGNEAPVSQVIFTNSNERLARQVYELVTSLGWRATVVRQVAWTVPGFPGGYVSWSVKWTPRERVFLLHRKFLAQNLPTDGVDGGDWRSRYRYIVNVRRVASRPVRCIAVDSASRLFLAGEAMIPTHNSNLEARVAMGRMDMTPSLMVLDSDRATRIPKVLGRGVLRQGMNTLEFQGYWCDIPDLKRLVMMDQVFASRDGVDAGSGSGGGSGLSGGSGVGSRLVLGVSGLWGRVSGLPGLSGAVGRFGVWWRARAERAAAHDSGVEPERSGGSGSSSESPVSESSVSGSSSSVSGGSVDRRRRGRGSSATGSGSSSRRPASGDGVGDGADFDVEGLEEGLATLRPASGGGLPVKPPGSGDSGSGDSGSGGSGSGGSGSGGGAPGGLPVRPPGSGGGAPGAGGLPVGPPRGGGGGVVELPPFVERDG